jgi:hypothetical protein
MPRKRTISQIIGSDNTAAIRLSSGRTHSKRTKVRCYCGKCNGKLVLKRTKLLHNTPRIETPAEISDEPPEPLNEQPDPVNEPSEPMNEPSEPLNELPEPLNELPEPVNELPEPVNELPEPVNELPEPVEPPVNEPPEHEPPDIGSDVNEDEETSVRRSVDDLIQEPDDTYIPPENNFLPRSRVRRYTRHPQNTVEIPADRDSESDELSEFESEQHSGPSLDENESNNEAIAEIFEDYSSPSYEDPNMFREYPTNERFLWILLWIMNFRTKFNISETATESLIKFVKLILTEIGGDAFSDFPNSLYLAKNSLGIKDRFQSFVPCTKCHKLYRKDEVESYRQHETLTIMKCKHVEFPNSLLRRTRLCNTPLSRQKNVSNRIVIQPELIYPFSGIRQQLATMFRRPDFEKSLRHWTNRKQFDDKLTDIYDGQVWRNFKESNEENSARFFRPEMADSHLGLMLNLDWFQPYDGTMHSTGALYAAICNLPRDIRFKRENLLLLGLLPGPNEVSLHKINHYLAPVVDELKSFWIGIALDRTYEHRNGKNIRAALILISCDIPAARKICGHVSALVSCHRCEKTANYEDHQHNFAGMENMSDWFITRDSVQHRQDALAWRRCNSDAARK